MSGTSTRRKHLCQKPAEDIDSTCKLSIPLIIINQAPSKTIEGLHNRLKNIQAIPDGYSLLGIYIEF